MQHGRISDADGGLLDGEWLGNPLIKLAGAVYVGRQRWTSGPRGHSRCIHSSDANIKQHLLIPQH